MAGDKRQPPPCVVAVDGKIEIRAAAERGILTLDAKVGQGFFVGQTRRLRPCRSPHASVHRRGRPHNRTAVPGLRSPPRPWPVVPGGRSGRLGRLVPPPSGADASRPPRRAPAAGVLPPRPAGRRTSRGVPVSGVRSVRAEEIEAAFAADVEFSVVFQPRLHEFQFPAAQPLDHVPHRLPELGRIDVATSRAVGHIEISVGRPVTCKPASRDRCRIEHRRSTPGRRRPGVVPGTAPPNFFLRQQAGGGISGSSATATANDRPASTMMHIRTMANKRRTGIADSTSLKTVRGVRGVG